MTAFEYLKKIENKPALRQVVEEKGINAVRPVLGVATAENEKFWAQKSRTMSKNTLETYVRESKISGTANVPQNLWRTSTPQRVTLEMELDPEIADQLKKLKGREDWNILMKQLLEMRKKELEAKKPSR